jgi:hypothetical protein
LQLLLKIIKHSNIAAKHSRQAPRANATPVALAKRLQSARVSHNNGKGIKRLN